MVGGRIASEGDRSVWRRAALRPGSRAAPAPAQLQQYAGVYTSTEAETTLSAAVDADRLVIRRRPDARFTLTALYADAFSAPELGTVMFRRDGTGQVTGLSVVQDRVWDLRFVRQRPETTSARR